MTNDKKREYLLARGWHTWYNEDYWVNPNIIKDSKSQDYTNYGMNIDKAYIFETELKDVKLKAFPFNKIIDILKKFR